MANTRTYYANSAFYVKPVGSTGLYNFTHGVQTCSDTFNLNSQTINEWGQIEPYETIELTPEGTLQVERVLDGCAPLYCLATEGSPNASLPGRQDAISVAAIAIYDSANPYVSGTPTRAIEFSGLNVNSIAYNFSTDGPFTESVGFIGNYRLPGSPASYGTFPSNPTTSGTDEPCALTSCSGGVQVKENLVFSGTYPTLMPTDIAGVINSTGTDNGTIPLVNGCPTVPVQSISISAELNRETVDQLGCRGSYARYASFPVDVTCEIVVLSQSGDNVAVTELGTFDGCDYSNAPPQRIRVATTDGLIVDLGDKLKLNSVASQWGGADGGNTTYTLSYIGKSVLSVFHPNDPSNLPYAGIW